MDELTTDTTFDMVLVDSSNIASVGYNAESALLRVQFRNGGMYEYSGVQPEVHAGLLKASSAGGYFHSMIKPSYPARRV